MVLQQDSSIKLLNTIDEKATLLEKFGLDYLIIQPFDEFPENETQTIAVELRKVYSKVTINKNIPFPSNSLNSSGKRYRADSLIKYLSKQASKNTLIIGLTNKDISTQKGKIRTGA